jgi:hypothetical protein
MELVETTNHPTMPPCNGHFFSLVKPSSPRTTLFLHRNTNTTFTMPAATTTSEIIFSEQANHNFSKTLGELKRSTLSIRNRLESIKHDAAFAQHVAEAYSRPLIANERCGSWYIDPKSKGGSAYFKSTDGHTGVWRFSSRRLNLHLLEIIGRNDGYATLYALY